MAGQELFFELQVLKESGRYRIRCFMPAVGDRPEGTSAWSYFMPKG